MGWISAYISIAQLPEIVMKLTSLASVSSTTSVVFGAVA